MEPAVIDLAALVDCTGAPLLVGEGATDERGALATLVGADEPELALELELALGGVNGTVVLRPGSSVVWTLAANCAKVLLPVVGALMAPYMLEESFVTGPVNQKNKILLPHLAVRGATTEEPDGGVRIVNRQRVYTD